MKKLFLIAAAALSLGCGASSLQTCNTHCDCKSTDAPVKCPGEWACASGTCEYQCRSQCTQLPYTCASNEECNGSICSVRKGC
jgi:hypothetical protein